MGTNFYFTSSSPAWRQRFWPKVSTEDCEPGMWEVHIAKTSFGWLPLFEQHPAARLYSVRDLQTIYEDAGGDGGALKIVDEYGVPYTWAEFDKRVLQFGSPKVLETQEDAEGTHYFYSGDWRSEQDNDLGGTFYKGRTVARHWDSEYRDQYGYRFSIREFC